MMDNRPHRATMPRRRETKKVSSVSASHRNLEDISILKNREEELNQSSCFPVLRKSLEFCTGLKFSRQSPRDGRVAQRKEEHQDLYTKRSSSLWVMTLSMHGKKTTKSKGKSPERSRSNNLHTLHKAGISLFFQHPETKGFWTHRRT